MKHIGSFIAGTLSEDSQIESDQKHIYAYLFDYIIEQLIFDAVVLIIGVVSGRFVITLCFLAVTIPMRHFAGGFHASTPWMCNILSYGSYILTILITPVLEPYIHPYWAVVYVLLWGLILFIAPIDTPNKRLNAEQKSKLLRLCVKTCAIMSVLYLIFVLSKQTIFYGAITLCMAESALGLYIGFAKNRREKCISE